MMHAEIISIGEELLSGDSDIIDTNSIYITKQLRAIGIKVLYKTTVGDEEPRIIEVIRAALNRVDFVITTGGLGPTIDDKTRQGVAGAVGRGLEFHQNLLDEIAEKFVRFGVRMSDNNRVQAYLPEGATVIPNPAGTAPGFLVEYEGKFIYSVPGVPREMKVLMENTVIPHIRGVLQERGGGGVVKTRVLRTAGIGESLIDEKIGDLEQGTNPIVGLAAHAGQTDIRIYAQGATEEDADALIAATEADIRGRMGEYIFGVDKEPLEAAFVELLRQGNLQVAIAEHGTEDRLRKRIERVGGTDVIAPIDPVQIQMIFAEAQSDPQTNGDTRKMAEKVSAMLFAQGAPIVITAFSEKDRTAISVTDGSDSRSRGYSYGGADLGGPEFASGWGLSMAWYMVAKRVRANPTE
jgi:nicotinamide-nucleotide amidase